MKELCEKARAWVTVNKKAVMIGGGIVGAIVLISLGVFFFRSKPAPALEVIVAPEPVVEPVVTKPVRRATRVSAKAAPRLSYTEAVRVYGGRRIQFSEICAATPMVSTYKTGTTLMLDNRSNKVRTFKVRDTVYTVPAYDYALAKVESTTTPEKVLIDCDASQNVATVLVQK